MKIKYLTLSAILILSSVAMQAQFGILGGVNFQNINGKNSSGDKLENGLLTGWHAGISVNIPLSTNFNIQPGLLYSVKGSMNEFFNSPVKAAGDYTTTTRLSYIEMPLNLVFRPKLGNGYLLLGAGPYVAYGISGTETTQLNSISVERPVKFKNTAPGLTDLLANAYYRPFDAGANFLVGFEFGMGLFFQVNAQLGLLKINPEYTWISNDEAAYMNTGYGASLGIRF